MSLRRPARTCALLPALVLCALIAAPTAPAAPLLAQVGSFAEPTYVTAAPGDPGRLYVTERTGRVMVVRDGVAQTFLDLGSRVDSDGYEKGLLSIAFPPDHQSTGLFYVFYTGTNTYAGPGSTLTVAEFRRRNPDEADESSARWVLRIPHWVQANHNGGQLQFDGDGLLWVSTGDGGGPRDPAGNGQNLDPSRDDDRGAGRNALLAKLLRIDPQPGNGCDARCTVPAGNPGFAAAEVWAYGLRNPWRFSFDRLTGDLFVGDVGQDTAEEINIAAAPERGRGFNWGWAVMEGDVELGAGHQPEGELRAPAIVRRHSDDWHSIVGGYVVRDPGLPSLYGRYLFADTFRRDIWAASLDGTAVTALADTGLRASSLVSFGEDACGRVHAVSIEGPVFRITEGGGCAAASPRIDDGLGTLGDARPPQLHLRAVRQRPLRSGTAAVRAQCSEDCRVRVAVKLGSRRLGTHDTTLAARARVSLRVKLSPAARRWARRAFARRRTLPLVFTVTALDLAGNGTTATVRATASR